jgi:dTDP-4-amino-4,6-dideoxygalactose transaminase
VLPQRVDTLHNSPIGGQLNPDQPPLPATEDISGRLLRLPMYHELLEQDVDRVTDEITRCLLNK